MPKKTVSLITNGGNDYIIGLKQNQPTLYKAAHTVSLTQPPLSSATTIDQQRARTIKRLCQVFCAPENTQKSWLGLKTFIKVERSGIRDRQPFEEHQFYISSHILSAEDALDKIQGHWGIENPRHWVRDVTFAEDFPPRRGGNAPVNWAILHNFFITISCFLGFRTIPQAQRALANQLDKVFSFFV